MSDFNETCMFLDGFLKNDQTSNLMKTNPVGAELLRADGQTNPKLIIALRTSLQMPFVCFERDRRYVKSGQIL
jgi:hypothetical protein